MGEKEKKDWSKIQVPIQIVLSIIIVILIISVGIFQGIANYHQSEFNRLQIEININYSSRISLLEARVRFLELLLLTNFNITISNNLTA